MIGHDVAHMISAESTLIGPVGVRRLTGTVIRISGVIPHAGPFTQIPERIFGINNYRDISARARWATRPWRSCPGVADGIVVCHGARIGVYIWCRNCHAASMLLEDPDGMMGVPTGGAKQSPSMLVALSDVSVSTLSCAVRPDNLEFRYRF